MVIRFLPFRLIASLATSLCAFGAADLPRIRLEPPPTDGKGPRAFVRADGRRFVPLGVTYYRPGTGWAPQVWKQFDPEATRRDFARLRELGANCVRVFLTYGSFHKEPGVLDEDGFRKLETFLELAAEHQLYVHPTGPDHWEGLPSWARGDRISDPAVLRALEGFWTTLAGRLRGRGVVFAYDLLNEPEVPWDTPALRVQWNAWLTRRYGTHDACTNGWGRADVPAFGAIEPPPKDNAPMDRRLLDFQRFREDVAETWTRRQAAAIRAADPDALVTVGLIQWSVPAVLPNVGHYSAFRPDRQAPHVDFLSFHFYPLENGAYLYQGDEAERRNLAYLDILVRECAAFGRPVVLGEFGWHGGGAPRAFKNAPVATEADQARWCSRVVSETQPWIAGWLNWGLHDQPEATDVSQFTGLLTAEGRMKAWGQSFQRLAATLTNRVEIPQTPAPAPSIDWDRQVTDKAAVDRFRAARWEAYNRPR